MSLSFVLHAKNSSGHQMLFLDRQPDGAFQLTLCGTYEGKEIQLDFDELSKDDLDDLIRFLSSRLPKVTRS